MTTDAELRTGRDDTVSGGAAKEWLADRQLVRALVEQLPNCDECAAPATFVEWGARGVLTHRCDEHRIGVEFSYATALRALLARVAQWDGGGR
jgi:hypothetical protein